MGSLLLFNISDPDKRTAIRLLSLRLRLQTRDVLPEEQSRTIRELLTSAPETAKTQKPANVFRDEMLLMSGLSPLQFHTLLDTLREQGQRIALKAVVTEHNREWTALQLHRELRAEEEAMRKRKQKKQVIPG